MGASPPNPRPPRNRHNFSRPSPVASRRPAASLRLMLGLRHVLAPRAVKPEHAALGGVALLALAATPAVLGSLPEETTHLRESAVALPLAALVTAALSV